MKINVRTTTEIDPKTIKVCAKCCDSFNASLLDETGKTLFGYDGYVPSFFPGKHYGDYLMLDIDIETGQILNWKKPTAGLLEDWINGENDG